MVKYPLMATKLKLPDLEKSCRHCAGKGHVYDGEEDCYADCGKCNGSGLVPTATGLQVLALVRHQFRVTVTSDFSTPAVR